MPRYKKTNAQAMPALPPSVRTAREAYEKSLREYAATTTDVPLLTPEERKQLLTRLLPYAVHYLHMIIVGDVRDAKVSDRLFAAQLIIQHTVPKPDSTEEQQGKKTMSALKDFLLEHGHDIENGEAKIVGLAETSGETLTVEDA